MKKTHPAVVNVESSPKMHQGYIVEFSDIDLCAQCTAYTQRKLSLVELGGATYIVVALLYTMYSRLLVYTLTGGASSSA